jgi:hypothetical protein
MSENTNNPNRGGAGIGGSVSAIADIVPEQVNAEEPMSLWTAAKKLPGSDYLEGEPAGREAKPNPKYVADDNATFGR